ncbi:hypothetical protein BC936DRAFT_142306 [Jimgerdemannia flammicorona]|uniref:Uncharacterized protein n=1 Tax=Jimgerdemannia flammicorona TaxID=994334 RepID=A0A433A0J2_9FUNG|nr:hypothetical protein BC936DRAFT_142306 [Jimgerdemannia flammicorona]
MRLHIQTTSRMVGDYVTNLRSLLKSLAFANKNPNDNINEENQRIVIEWAQGIQIMNPILSHIVADVAGGHEVQYGVLHGAILADIEETEQQQANRSPRVMIIESLKSLEGFLKQHQRYTLVGISVLVLLIALGSYNVIHKDRQSSPFEDFASSSEAVFRKINNVELPASNVIVRHKVECLRAANTVESSPAFKEHGTRMAVYLRNFGNHVSDAGESLQAMYRRGNSLFETFDIEIRDMIRKADDGAQFTDTEYIAKRMAVLRDEVKRYQHKVSETKGIVLTAKETRDLAEKALIEGRREGEDFLHNETKGKQKDDDSISPAVRNAFAELNMVDAALKHLDSMSHSLEIINGFLADYNNELMELESRIVVHKSVTRRDIELLWTTTQTIKKQHALFLKKNIGHS